MTKDWKQGPHPDIARLVQARDEVKEAVREAHEVLKDLAQERKAIEKLRDEGVEAMFQTVRDNVDEFVLPIVNDEMERYKGSVSQAIDAVEKGVYARFDELLRKLTMTTPKDKREGNPNLDTIVQGVVDGEYSLTRPPAGSPDRKLFDDLFGPEVKQVDVQVRARDEATSDVDT